MKERICAAVGVLGAAVASLLGGWDAVAAALVVCMALDYISGSLVALVFKRSDKTETGSYSSAYGFRGLCKKGMILLLVLMAVRLDRALGSDYIRDGVCCGFLANELISLLENAGLMGLPIPKAIAEAIETLRKKR